MQAIMAKALKNRASKKEYISPMNLVLPGFETTFENQLDPENRWVIMANQIPWDIMVSKYQRHLNNQDTGADGINPRVAIGSMIIKHICDLSDRETVQQIRENIYMQYFIGYSSFSTEIPFDPSLFVDFRKRLTLEDINKINEEIVKKYYGLCKEVAVINSQQEWKEDQEDNNSEKMIQPTLETKEPITHQGKLIMDATACPQDIAYPTDLNLLNDSREKSELIIDTLQLLRSDKVKPRTYREKARKEYLKIAQKKTKTKREIRKGIRQQLQYLKRNISHIHNILNEFKTIPLDYKLYKYLLVIQTLYDQQKSMYDAQIHSIPQRIVSIHQPHVRPIVRGKTNAPVEFGSKIQVSMMDGFAFLDELSWEAFNEGTKLQQSVESYKERFGYYPEEVLADKIYCTRENRAWLKKEGIELRAKPLGRPSIKPSIVLSPGERNPIEGKFGQAKTAYGMNRIKARLDITSKSWISTIILVLNLVKLAGQVSFFIADLLNAISRILNRIRKEVYKSKMKFIIDPGATNLSADFLIRST